MTSVDWYVTPYDLEIGTEFFLGGKGENFDAGDGGSKPLSNFGAYLKTYKMSYARKKPTMLNNLCLLDRASS